MPAPLTTSSAVAARAEFDDLSGGGQRGLLRRGRERERRDEREASELQAMQELGDSLSKLILVIQVRSGDEGRMFGSITASSISEELESQYEVHLERRKINLEDPIRVIGDHEVELRLHPEVHTMLKVRAHSINAPTTTASDEKKEGESDSATA